MKNGKKLYKVREGKVLAGVCQGLAEYLDIDVSIVRILTVVLALCYSVGLVAYIAAALILPWKEDLYPRDDFDFQDPRDL